MAAGAPFTPHPSQAGYVLMWGKIAPVHGAEVWRGPTMYALAGRSDPELAAVNAGRPGFQPPAAAIVRAVRG